MSKIQYNEWDSSSKDTAYLHNHTEDLKEIMNKQGSEYYKNLFKDKKVSDLTVVEFYEMLTHIVKDEINKSMVYQIPQYREYEIPNTPGEINKFESYTTTNYTIYDPNKLPVWNKGYKENKEKK